MNTEANQEIVASKSAISFIEQSLSTRSCIAMRKSGFSRVTL
jgi:hypothetical protein